MSSLTVENIRVVRFTEKDWVVVVAIGNEMYCWEVHTQRFLWRVEVVGRGEYVLKVGRVGVMEGRVGVVGVVRGDGRGMVVEVRWMDRMQPPRLLYLGEAPSLFRNISNSLFSLWTKPEQTQLGFVKYTILKVSQEKIECAMIRDSVIEKYTVEINGDARRVRHECTLDLRKDYPVLMDHEIGNVLVELDNHFGPI